jgi:pimeloyl-ACP methyl ester carboxylesterase
MQEAKPIEGIPVVVLTPPTAEPVSADALQRISPSAQQILAEKSGHWVHLDEPVLVLEAIREMVEHTRSNTPEPVEAFPS